MTIHDFTAKGRNGTSLDLASLKGKVLLIVNTATGCGFTPQYEGLEKLYAKYHDKGLEILDFPCDQFGHQAPGSDDEIHNFCALKYNTTFDQLAKIEVNGPGADPIYVFLKAARPKDDATDEAIAGLRDAQRRVDELRPKLAPGPDGRPAITEEELLELIPRALSCGANDVAGQAMHAAQMRLGSSTLFPVKLGLVLCQSGRADQAARILSTVVPLLSDPSLSGEDVRTAVTALLATGKAAESLAALRPYLRDRGSDDWRAWVQFALASYLLGDDDTARIGVAQARKFGGQEAEALMQRQLGPVLREREKSADGTAPSAPRP